MASIIPGYEYDIFISYRHNDNLDGWVSEFVQNLEKELKGTIKEPVSIYFDTNPHDGLLETHNVDKSLENKLKCLIFIPVISQTYCDPKSFAWQNEFCAFNKLARDDKIGIDVKLPDGNVSGRLMPIRIHDLHQDDTIVLENELGGAIRAIDFIYKEPGVNRPLKPVDNKNDNQNKTDYKNQVNKVANAIYEIIRGIRESEISTTRESNKSLILQSQKLPFTKKLTGRNVLRASLVYILTSLIFWKVLVISSGFLHLREDIIQIIALVMIVLFPVAMLMAWLYERSPNGFIRTGSVASLENPYSDTKKKPFTSITFISLLLATSIALFLLFPLAGRTNSMDNIGNAEKSIAVLPFENMSNDPEQEYFSDGIMQEILNHLFMIGGLIIPSGTSSMRFKGSKLSVREIARELNVSYVLEGNVSRSDNNVRIIVRLINGENEELLWTEDYRRSMTATDILEIQSDVAMQVAANLKVVIDPEVKKRIQSRPTENTEVYTLYLQALNTSPDSMKKTMRLLERAVSLDPGFADAYAYMAYIRMWDMSDSLSREQILEKVNPLLTKALELDSNSIVAHNAKAELSLWYYWDLETVEKEYQIVNQLSPSNVEKMSGFVQYLWIAGRTDEAYKICKDNFEENNATWFSWLFMALAYSKIGDQEKALETIESVLRLFPHDNFLIKNAFDVFDSSEKYGKLIELFEKDLSGKGLHNIQDEILGPLGIAYYKTGQKSRSTEILNELLSRKRDFARNESSGAAASIYLVMGEKDKALDCLEEAYARHEMGLVALKSDSHILSKRIVCKYLTIVM